MERLTTRSKFAALAGVSPAAITRVSRTILAPACVGNRINLEHPAAVAYLERSHLKPAAAPVGGGHAAGGPQRPAGAPEAKAPGVPQSPQSPGPSRAPEAPQNAGSMSSPGETAGAPEAKAPDETPAALKRNPGVRPKRDPGERAPKAPPPPSPPDPVTHDGSDMQRYGDMTLRELVAQFGTDVRFLDWLRASQTLEAIQEKRIKNAQATGDLVARDLIRRAVMDPVGETATKLLTDASRTISARTTAMAAAGATPAEVETVVVDILQSYIKPLKEKMRRALAAGS